MQNLTDEEIKEILKSAKNIAVVGLSDKPGRDSHRVAAYLKTRGYKIFPVNPTISLQDPEGWERRPWGRTLTLGWRISPNL